MKTLFAAMALMTMAAPARADRSEPVPSNDRVRLRSVSYAGTGCPAGSVAAAIPDAKHVVLLFDAFYPEVGPGLPLSQTRKNCQVNLDVTIPPNLQAALSDLTV